MRGYVLKPCFIEPAALPVSEQKGYFPTKWLQLCTFQIELFSFLRLKAADKSVWCERNAVPWKIEFLVSSTLLFSVVPFTFTFFSSKCEQGLIESNWYKRAVMRWCGDDQKICWAYVGIEFLKATNQCKSLHKCKNLFSLCNVNIPCKACCFKWLETCLFVVFFFCFFFFWCTS